MSKIILDFGSGNTCQNNPNIIKDMYDELDKVNTRKHEVIVKWQLFKKAPPNIPLSHSMFTFAYDYGRNLNYQVTASVFDKESLDFLLSFPSIPFVKIACRPDLYWLINEVPRKHIVYVSCNDTDTLPDDDKIEYLECVRNYPAKLSEYEKRFNWSMFTHLNHNVSDHTAGLDLYKKYRPIIWEKHYKLEDSTGPDAGEFAITPGELKKIL